MFDSLSERLEGAFKSLKGDGKLTEINVATSIKEIRRALVGADVNYKIAKEFTDKINEVNVKSLEFHFYRGDFEKWTAEVLEDEELAEDVQKLQKLSLTGDELRLRLYTTVSRRYSYLISHLSTSRI